MSTFASEFLMEYPLKRRQQSHWPRQLRFWRCFQRIALTLIETAVKERACLYGEEAVGPSNQSYSQPLLTSPLTASVGLYTIQIAAQYGLNVITTCSPQNFDLVRSYGASSVFNYREEDVAQKIKKTTPELQYTFDTIGSPESSALASRAVGHVTGVLCTVRPGKAHTEQVAKHVKVTDVLVWTAFLKDHRYGKFHWPVCPPMLKMKLPLLTRRSASQRRP